MLSSSERNKLIDKLNTSFANIGKKNGTQMPPSPNNLEPAAWDLFVAQHLSSMANKRKEQAEKQAVRMGIMIDKDKHPMAEGTKASMYDGDIVHVMLAVGSSAQRVNNEKLCAYLIEMGVSPTLVAEATAAATVKNRPAHVFSSYLVSQPEG